MSAESGPPDPEARTPDGPLARLPIWARGLLGALAVAALVAPLVIWHDPIWALVSDRERIASEVRRAGIWGPILLAGLLVAQTIAAPIPGQVANFVAGYLYGLGPGFLLSWTGMMLGSTLAMLLARYAGRPLIRRLIGRRDTEKLDRLVRSQGLRFFFLAFLIPGLPDDLLCFAAGLTALRLSPLVAIIGLARVPGVLAAVWLGATAETLSWQAWAGLIAGVLLAGVAAWRFGPRIQDCLLRRAAR